MFGPAAQHVSRDSSWLIPSGYLGTNPLQGAGLPLRGCFLQADFIDHRGLGEDLGGWTEMHFVDREGVGEQEIP